jgi:formylglycine-generating enzyme
MLRRHFARPRVAITAIRGVLLLSAVILAPSCLVSFDGYQPLAVGGGGDTAAGESGVSGKATGGSKANGGKGGVASAGADPGNAGETSSDAGESGTSAGGTPGSGGGDAGGGGTPTAGSAGTSMGGNPNAGTGGNAGAGGGGGKTCPVNLEGPQLIEIPKASGGIYCMDRTEVTNDQYALFLASNPSTAGQDAACSWNSSFEPDISTACAATEDAKYDPLLRPKVPVGCIDWCDAKRYCAWAGKRLCGAIGGGSNPTGSFADANASQWYRACSKAGTQKFPYGNQYNKSYCNGADTAGFHPATVGNLPNCVGGYNGIYDMSGNVAEWEDSCSASAGANDTCLIRGGSIEDIDVLAPSLLCNSSAPDDATPSPATAKRSSKDELVGIRCCLDP